MGIEKIKTITWDERRTLLLPGDNESTIAVCARHFVATCKQAISDRDKCFVALCGGSTPKKIYQLLASEPYKEKLDWSKVFCFFGDERNVPPSSDESNYKMALDAGLTSIIPPSQIFRMKAEDNLEENAHCYETLIKEKIPDQSFDLVMLGMGEDGHTASLFPQTEGLKEESRLVITNYVPQKNTNRMTLTYKAINQAHNIAIYVLGSSKKQILKEVLESDRQIERYPIQNIGTEATKALWIIDDAAADLLDLSEKE